MYLGVLTPTTLKLLNSIRLLHQVFPRTEDTNREKLLRRLKVALTKKKLWRVVRSLNGKRSFLPPNQPISFGSATFSDKKVIADHFIHQYTPSPCSNKRSCVVLRNIHKKFPIDQSYKSFLKVQVEDAIKQSINSTATGLDGLAPEHFKHLGNRAIEYLTELFN
jgi:hypothetical protein